MGTESQRTHESAALRSVSRETNAASDAEMFRFETARGGYMAIIGCDSTVQACGVAAPMRPTRLATVRSATAAICVSLLITLGRMSMPVDKYGDNTTTGLWISCGYLHIRVSLHIGRCWPRAAHAFAARNLVRRYVASRRCQVHACTRRYTSSRSSAVIGVSFPDVPPVPAAGTTREPN